MNFKKIGLILFILLLLPFTIKVFGSNNFGQTQSLFTDIKANRVGDILTVLIFEQSRATQKAEAKTSKSTKASIEGGPGIGPLRFIPIFGADGKNSSTFDGKGESIRNGTFSAKMSVTVIAVKESGDLIIEGSRTIGLSGDRETMGLTGVVRQKDISPNNTIDSYLIADAEISYTGKGNSNSAHRPGFFTRFFNWVF
ncbi:MAG TPA: flagellar basal body L-ring protein FlgH [candidate division Zixibacteria bacterium]|nr:flagellar basal body L-ring protein FlgH [candidate division Zixibacteria bacterium]